MCRANHSGLSRMLRSDSSLIVCLRLQGSLIAMLQYGKGLSQGAPIVLQPLRWMRGTERYPKGVSASPPRVLGRVSDDVSVEGVSSI